MAYDRGGASGGNGSKSYKDTLKEYKAFYEERHGGGGKSGFSNSQSSKRADDPYFDNKKPAGHYMAPPAMQRPQPSYQMKEERGWDWKEQNQWNNKIHNPQKAPPGLLPPRTAPDTPNVTRQNIENSPILSERAKGIVRTVPTKTDYTVDKERKFDGYYEWPSDWKPRGNDNGRIVSFGAYPEITTHETVHATQGLGTPWSIDNSQFGRDFVRDTQGLSDQGYTKFGDIMRFVQSNYGTAQPSEVQAYVADGNFMNPAEVPPWYREKYLSDVWSPQAMAAVPPPRPSVSPIQAPVAPAPPSYGRMLDSANSIRMAYLDEIRRQSEFPVRWR